MYRMFFFALKKVPVVKITPLSDSHPIENPSREFPVPLPLNIIWKTLDKGPSLLKFVCLFKVKFNCSIDNI